MTENPELFLKIIGTVAGAIFTYHKYITTQLEKKVDKDDCHSTHEYIKEIRTENAKTLFKSITKIEERLGRIESYFITHTPNDNK